MTKFSPEYIKFVTNSEAIQRLWRERGVRVGDWCIRQRTTGRKLIGFVQKQSIEQADGFDLPSWVVNIDLDGYGWLPHVYCNKPKHIPEDWAWLPTLDDLVEGVVQAITPLEIEFEQVAGLQINYDAGDETWIPWIHDELFSKQLVETDYESDVKLVLAHLLERVLEEEKHE